MLTQQESVVDAIARAVREHPGRDAVETADGRIPYREFGERVREFAARLETLTAPGEFIGIEARRAAHPVIAMIGALTAGRPFVMLDPRDSTASNTARISTLGIRVLARRAADADTPEPVPTPGEWRAEHGPSVGALRGFDGVTGYAIHTSGSTGEPKCVLVAAAPLAPMVADHVRRLEPGPGCRTLQFARLTFDGCVTEILWTLTSGACLVVLDESHLTPGAVLAATLVDRRITHLKTTPFALTATEPTAGMTLRHVINGGGACRPAVVRKWSAVAGFHNAYGLTETTVCNLLSDTLTPDDCVDGVPLGDVVGHCGVDVRPLPGAPSDADPVPGAPPAVDNAGRPEVTRGELVITGPSVAIGYLTPDGVRRFLDDDGAPAYRTGDIVERRGGRLLFVERRDRQLKVRGYRLDPGEVEGAACRLDGVVEAVVTAEAHDAGDAGADALVCYYQGTVDPRAMRAHLETLLDGYKIPSVITRVGGMPYTPNGKVDRDALRAHRLPAVGDADGGGTDVGPGERVLDLVRTLTGVADAGPDDNFFDIGGDSASTVLLVNRLKELGWTAAGVRDVLRAENLGSLIDTLRERIG